MLVRISIQIWIKPCTVFAFQMLDPIIMEDLMCEVKILTLTDIGITLMFVKFQSVLLFNLL